MTRCPAYPHCIRTLLALVIHICRDAITILIHNNGLLRLVRWHKQLHSSTGYISLQAINIEASGMRAEVCFTDNASDYKRQLSVHSSTLISVVYSM